MIVDRRFFFLSFLFVVRAIGHFYGTYDCCKSRLQLFHGKCTQLKIKAVQKEISQEIYGFLIKSASETEHWLCCNLQAEIQMQDHLLVVIFKPRWTSCQKKSYCAAAPRGKPRNNWHKMQFNYRCKSRFCNPMGKSFVFTFRDYMFFSFSFPWRISAVLLFNVFIDESFDSSFKRKQKFCVIIAQSNKVAFWFITGKKNCRLVSRWTLLVGWLSRQRCWIGRLKKLFLFLENVRKSLGYWDLHVVDCDRRCW